MKFRFFPTIALTASLMSANATAALESVPELSLNVAKRMVEACEAKAIDEGWLMNIAVVDRGANLLAFGRMNNAFLGSIEISINKAKTSARFPWPTRFFGELSFGKDGQPGGLPGIAFVDEVVAFAGGLPIMAGGVQIGGIGVSGATADQDEACAQAALDAVSSDLN